MQLPTLALFALLSFLSQLTTASSWLPPWGFPWSSPSPECIDKAYANLTFTRIRSMLSLQPTDLGTPVESLAQIIASNFESTSDSYSMIGGRLGDVGKVGTIDRAGELAEGGNATARSKQSGIQTLALGPVGCLGAFWFWNLTMVGGKEVRYPIRGMHYLVFNEEFKITELHTETNSLAYAADLGFKIEYPNGTVLPSMKTSS